MLHTHRQTYKHIYTLTDIRIYTHGQRKTDVYVYTHTGRETYKCTHSDTHRWTEKDRCIHTHTQAERHKLPDTDRQTAFVYSLLPRFPSVRLPHSSLLVFAFLIAVLFIPSPRASPHMLFMSQIKRSTFLSLFYSRALLWPAVAPRLMRTWSLLRFHTLLVKYHCECDVCVISMWRVLYLKKKKKTQTQPLHAFYRISHTVLFFLLQWI